MDFKGMIVHTKYILNFISTYFVLDGKTEIFPPEIPEKAELVPHNVLAAHMFNVHTGCQAMQQLQINPTKNSTIHLLLHKHFQAIKSSDNKQTNYVTPKTISYIHGIVTDSITGLTSDACNQRALSNEIMILEVLEKQEPAVFRQKWFNTLTHYYEEIQSMSCAGGCPKPKSFKRTMHV